jgi:hypothetical protein
LLYGCIVWIGWPSGSEISQEFIAIRNLTPLEIGPWKRKVMIDSNNDPVVALQVIKQPAMDFNSIPVSFGL